MFKKINEYLDRPYTPEQRAKAEKRFWFVFGLVALPGALIMFTLRGILVTLIGLPQTIRFFVIYKKQGKEAAERYVTQVMAAKK